jgi:hypothetical protein
MLERWVKEELEKKTGTTDYGETIKHHQQQSLFADEPVCDRPKFVQGQPVSDVPLDEFTCDHDYYYYFYETESNGEEDNADSKHEEAGSSDNNESDRSTTVDNDADDDDTDNYADEEDE